MKWCELLSTKRVKERKNDEKSLYDERHDFEIDFEKVCSSAQFRRLQDKAQVFPLKRGDFARTRLTHSIEVMSIAESLGNNIVRVIKEKEEEICESVNKIPIVLKTAALLHDIGNPPFGHLGEEIINEWFTKNSLKFSNHDNKLFISSVTASHPFFLRMNEQQRQDFYNFDGNANLLKLVTKLSGDNGGLELTYGVLSACIKYTSKSTEIDKANINKKKTGYFYSENGLFEEIQKETKTNYLRNPLVFILEAADDIAYLTADYEDAIKKGILKTKDLIDYIKHVDGYMSDYLLTNLIEKIEKTYMTISLDEQYLAKKICIYVRGKLINAVTNCFYNNYKSIMEGKYNEELLFCEETIKLQKVFREILKKYVYKCDEIVKSKIQVHKIMNTLLNYYVTASVNGENDDSDSCDALIYTTISENYRSVYKRIYDSGGKTPDAKLYYQLQLAVSQICGMTDLYAQEIYRKFHVSG